MVQVYGQEISPLQQSPDKNLWSQTPLAAKYDMNRLVKTL